MGLRSASDAPLGRAERAPKQGCAQRPTFPAPFGGVDTLPLGGPLYVDRWSPRSGGGFLAGRDAWLPHLLLQRSNGLRGGQCCLGNGCTPTGAFTGTSPLPSLRCNAWPYGVFAERAPNRGAAVGTADLGAPPPPRALIRPPFTAADVWRLVIDVVCQPPQEKPAQVGLPTQRPVADTAGIAVWPLRTGQPPPPPPPVRPDDRTTPLSQRPDCQLTASGDAASELHKRRPENSISSPKPNATSTGGRGSRLCRRLPSVTWRAHTPLTGPGPGQPQRVKETPGQSSLGARHRWAGSCPSTLWKWTPLKPASSLRS